MILTKSPHYITVPWLSPSSATTPSKYVLKIYVWSGSKSAPPSTATYEEENLNPLGLTGSIDINISPYVNDVLTLSLNTATSTTVLFGVSALWVKTEVIYYLGTVAQPPEFVSTSLASAGYGYGIEGKNPTVPSNNVLANGSIVNVSKNSTFTLPFLISESATVTTTVISYPSNNINYTITAAATNQSYQLIQKAVVVVSEALTDTYIEVKRAGVLIHTLNIKEELRYTPFDCYFKNKFGVLQSITFFKEKITSLKVNSESFESSIGQASDGVHQNSVYNKNGVTSFKAKTGFISETNNELIKQLLLSEKVWILEGVLFNPVNVSSSSIEYKSRQKDRLLDYEIDFTFAYNEINNQ